MGSGAEERDAGTPSSEVEALRARLYAPGATQADRDAYDDAMTTAPAPAEPHRESQPIARAMDAAEEPDLAADTHPAPPRRPRPRSLIAGIAGVALLGAGVAIGVGVGSAGSRPTADASSVTRSPTAVTPPPLPTPVAARTLRMSTAARTTAIARLTEVFASGTNDSTVDRAIEAVGSALSNPTTSGDWMDRYACSSSTGLVRASPRGRPLVLTPTDRAFSLPAQSHFRITILMTRPAAWSWTLSAQHGSAADAPIAVGAGSSEAGAAQYAEFDASGTGSLTHVTVSTTASTPFLWQLDSCISGS